MVDVHYHGCLQDHGCGRSWNGAIVTLKGCSITDLYTRQTVIDVLLREMLALQWKRVFPLEQ